ncbi:DNA polymerase-3 subunit epsilon [Flavobacteriaceae bacterium MAR_2010_72]|nr:DNA polymerase-3 subunit epsilon [Flavobacteriaceae bacterium MAR_2010_72]
MKNPFKIKSRRPNYPEYWLAYEALFTTKPTELLSDTRFVVLDTETTGFDYELDRILSIGAVDIVNYEINVANAFEIYLQQERFNEQTVAIHGLIQHERIETLTEKEAIPQLLNYIGNSVLVAHHAKFDMTMINHMLKRHNLPPLKNRVLDTVNLYRATRIKSNLIQQDRFSLDDIAEHYAIDICDRHTAAGDALITALIFLKTTTLLGRKKVFKLKQLFTL